MTTTTRPVWEPSTRQDEFLRRPEYEVLYGGAKFGLKTDALLGWAITRREKYPRSRGLFIRRMLSEITKQGAAWERIQAILGKRVEYNQTEHTVRFPNGSVQEFGHCKDEADKMQYQGAQYDDICFDQLEQFTETQYSFIQGSCRTPLKDPPTSSTGQVIVPRIRCSANPGDVGHAWVKAYYIDVCASGQPYTYTSVVKTPDGEELRLTRDRVYIPASVFDSVKAGVVSQDYITTLEKMPEPFRSAYLYGKWDVFVGQAFPSIRSDTHVIPTDYDMIARWRKVAGHDWGYGSPAAHLWFAIDPKGGAVIYREWSARHLQPDEVAQAILYRQGDEQVVTYGDPSMWRMQGTAYMSTDQLRNLSEAGKTMLTIADQYRQAGFLMQPANNARVAGFLRLQTMFGLREDGVPYLRFMDCCPDAFKTFQGIQLDEDKGGNDVLTEYPSDAEVWNRDEYYDCTRYAMMGVPTKATNPGPMPVLTQRWR